MVKRYKIPLAERLKTKKDLPLYRRYPKHTSIIITGVLFSILFSRNIYDFISPRPSSPWLENNITLGDRKTVNIRRLARDKAELKEKEKQAEKEKEKESYGISEEGKGQNTKIPFNI